METVQGYVILKAATFETGHGFALGHNPGAPSPFVTWQFTEGENGHRDYYWGRYGTSQAWAQRDFDRRVDDYQQFYHAAVKHTELGPEGVYRYYSTQRPVDIGTYPKPPDNSNTRFRQKIRQKSQTNQSCCGTYLRRNNTDTIPYFVHKLCTKQIYQQLCKEKAGRNQCDFSKCNLIIIMKF